jgi:hypothetical protein
MVVPTRSPLFIDKLSLTLAPKHHECERIKMRLEGLVLNGELERVDDNFSELRKGYRYAYRLWIGENYYCAIQVHPYKKESRFMRIEWNPARAPVGRAHPFQCIISVLSQCTTNCMELIHRARITRIDLSFDLKRIAVDSFFIREATGRSTSGHYKSLKEEFGADGRLNSRFIGKPDSGRYLLIYDKRQQLRDAQIRGNTRPSIRREGMVSKRIEAHLTRVELRLRDLNSIDALLSLENPYSRLTVSTFAGIQAVLPGHLGKFFVGACQWKGLQAVLSDIKNRRERKRYKDAIRESAPPSWWDSDAIWGGLPAAYYSALGIVPPTT